MTHVVQAGVEELIWVVVGIFWVIAQIAGASKKKKTPPQSINHENEHPSAPVDGDGFADLLRKLSGVQEIKAPTPPRAEAAPMRAARSERLAPPTEPGFTGRATPPVEPTRIEPVTEIAEVDIRPTMSSFRSIMPAMKLPSMKMSFRPSEESTATSPMLGQIIDPADKQTLRRAMLSHIIFSPPKALEKMK